MVSSSSTPPSYFADNPDDDDWRAARQYLDLIYPSGPKAGATIRRLRQDGKTVCFNPVIILAAAGRPLLPRSDRQVGSLMVRASNGHQMTPPILLRREPLLILTGYTHVCAAHYLDFAVDIPCRIA